MSDHEREVPENAVPEARVEDVKEQAGVSAQDTVTHAERAMPAILPVIPIFGRPVMPSQITPVQLSGEWEDAITRIANSESKLFAIFSLGDRNQSDPVTPDAFRGCCTLR